MREDGTTARLTLALFESLHPDLHDRVVLGERDQHVARQGPDPGLQPALNSRVLRGVDSRVEVETAGGWP